jgi:hypothetical protein
MGKYKVMMMALLAVFAFSAVAVSSASAAHSWLTLGGAAVNTPTAATTDGTLLLLVTKISSLFGSGSIDILCMGQFLGTVGPGSTDSITLFENLSAGEQDKLKCEVSKSTNTICTTGTLVIVEPDNLPWDTLLILIGSTMYDNLEALSGGKEVGYITTCAGVKILCATKLELAKWIENTSTGAVLSFEELLKATCPIGEGFARGTGTVLGFLAML